MYLRQLTENAWNIGLWLTPDGDYVESGVHIINILQNPSKFGLTPEFIDSVYAKHGEEKMQNGEPTEGEAREELITLVLQHGWIRVRRYRNYWSLTTYTIDRNTIENIKKFIRTFTKDGRMDIYDELRILSLKDDDLHTVDAEDIIKNRFKGKLND